MAKVKVVVPVAPVEVTIVLNADEAKRLRTYLGKNRAIAGEQLFTFDIFTVLADELDRYDETCLMPR